MKIVHAFWAPAPTSTFRQGGSFRLWAETLAADAQLNDLQPIAGDRHPFALAQADWPGLLEGLGAKFAEPPRHNDKHNGPLATLITLPSAAQHPLPSPQLAQHLNEPPDISAAQLQRWRIDSYPLLLPFKQLNELHFLASYQQQDLQLGGDYLFWWWFSQALKRLLLRDHYLPALIQHQPAKPKGRRKLPPADLYGSWQWASSDYQRLISDACQRMPAACAVGLGEDGGLADPESLLRHCAELLLDDTVRHTKLPATFRKKFDRSLLSACVDEQAQAWVDYRSDTKSATGELPEPYRQWRQWRQRLLGAEFDATFTLGFQLSEPANTATDNTSLPSDPASSSDYDWSLRFVAVPKDDPSQRIALADYWSASTPDQQHYRQQLGSDFETHLLLNLGLAARMVPLLWGGLENAAPQAVSLNLEQAFEFLKESAWLLEDAGFKVIVPAWWTPQGRQRAKIRLRNAATKTRSSPTAGAAAGAGHVTLGKLLDYSFELAIGDQAVDADEWQRLVESKSPLVQFRGQWVELDRDKMQQMLSFWQQHGDEAPPMSVQELLQRSATDDDFEVDRNAALGAMLDRLRDHSLLDPITDLPQLKAQLRDYQKRGTAWLGYLEQLGLGACLADDMGLGKTMQVIARLVQEHAAADTSSPPPATLLIAPTSVIGNWHKEIERFAPQLNCLIHHGPQRERDHTAFQQLVASHAMIITSYALARLDQKLFAKLDWHRVVLDEAQNIKNPKAAQTKAVLKLNATHRLALTGTPVENRLTDLWSIFNFINPGYLDSQARFRKNFEIPVQRDNNPRQIDILKRLVEPFILRRVKTDKRIIKDLPDKVEAIQYCNLSKEQAALYESVVSDVEQQLDQVESSERQGLMLSTLMRLKQICNHPAQFLQDGSSFDSERSHKLERLLEMLEEAIADGDSVLIFSQFTTIGTALETMLRRRLRCPTYWLHGGTSRPRREAMIETFQDPQSAPSILVLSLKAGGVGITLTQANHVFHFDRWWNPAVEDQASDRAFRIGQKKNVWVHKFVTLGTLEERINDMIEDKKALAGAIVGSDESWLTQLDNDRFKALIRLNRDSVVD